MTVAVRMGAVAVGEVAAVIVTLIAVSSATVIATAVTVSNGSARVTWTSGKVQFRRKIASEAGRWMAIVVRRSTDHAYSLWVLQHRTLGLTHMNMENEPACLRPMFG